MVERRRQSRSNKPKNERIHPPPSRGDDDRRRVIGSFPGSLIVVFSYARMVLEVPFSHATTRDDHGFVLSCQPKALPSLFYYQYSIVETSHPLNDASYSGSAESDIASSGRKGLCCQDEGTVRTTASASSDHRQNDPINILLCLTSDTRALAL
jgi:hypothetical protein